MGKVGQLLVLAAVVAMAAFAAATASAVPAAAGTWTLAFTVAPTAIPVGGTAQFSGMLTDASGAAVAGADVNVNYYTGAACTGEYGTWLGSEYPADQETAADGTFGFSDVSFDVKGVFSFQAWYPLAGGELPVNVTSACVTVAVGMPAAEAPKINNVFLCYSAFQDNPGVWPMDVAATLMKQGYWSPYAVPGNVAGGTNIGSYHLGCNLATGQSASDSTLGGAGEVYGAGSKPDVQGVPGHYPVIGG